MNLANYKFFLRFTKSFVFWRGQGFISSQQDGLWGKPQDVAFSAVGFLSLQLKRSGL